MTYLVPPKGEHRAGRSARPGQAKPCPGSAPAAPAPRERTPPWTALDLQGLHLPPHFDPSVTCLGALPDLLSAHAQNVKNTIKISTLNSHADRQTLGPCSGRTMNRVYTHWGKFIHTEGRTRDVLVWPKSDLKF